MTEPKPTAADAVHPIVRQTAEWAWRLLVIFALVAVLAAAVRRLDTVLIPLAIALLAAALLAPLVNWMQRRGVPRAVGVFVVLVGSLGLVAGVVTFVVEQFVVGVPQLSGEFTSSIHKVQDWLITGPLHLSDEQIRTAGDAAIQTIQSNQDTLTSGALTTATMIGHILTGTFLILFILIFFLYSGYQIWEFVTRIVPRAHRERVRTAGELGFGSLVGFVRATVAVAAVDAIGIGSGLALLGVPLALPLASLVFISAFIPVIGAFLAGFVAVFIALVTRGFVTALIVLGIIVAVMQVESHILQPLLLGRAVRIHPLAVVLAIAAGLVLGGIAGALLAVPLVAVLNTAIRSLLAEDPGELIAELAADRKGIYAAAADSPEYAASGSEGTGRFAVAALLAEAQRRLLVPRPADTEPAIPSAPSPEPEPVRAGDGENTTAGTRTAVETRKAAGTRTAVGERITAWKGTTVGDRKVAGSRTAAGDHPTVGKRTTAGDRAASGERMAAGERTTAGERAVAEEHPAAGSRSAAGDRRTAGKRTPAGKRAVAGSGTAADKRRAAGERATAEEGTPAGERGRPVGRVEKSFSTDTAEEGPSGGRRA